MVLLKAVMKEEDDEDTTYQLSMLCSSFGFLFVLDMDLEIVESQKVLFRVKITVAALQ